VLEETCREETGKLRYLVAPTLAQLPYFETALALLHGMSDEQLAAVDLVWHTHLQMPDRYHKDCVRIAGRLIDHDDTPEHTFSSVGG
jgi:hypothetical protein